MRADLVRRFQLFFLAVVVLGATVGILTTWLAARAGEGPVWLVKLAGPSQDLQGRHIGILAGHSGHDPGTVCDDGLTEASVNLAVAQGVVTELRRRGAEVDLLQEFDSRLEGYQADAFVSIHTDSCQSQLSGYKVAGALGAASQRLADCLWSGYGTSTGLARNMDTITDDMRIYHAFHKIATATPTAIIELGFLNTDRDLLTTQRDRPIEGILASLSCFLVRPRTTPTPEASETRAP